jgi:hypothetical protein
MTEPVDVLVLAEHRLAAIATGGLWFRAYAGGVATALVFGLQAAETALTATLSSSAPIATSRSIS